MRPLALAASPYRSPLMARLRIATILLIVTLVYTLAGLCGGCASRATSKKTEAMGLQQHILGCTDADRAQTLYERLRHTSVTEDVHLWVRAAEDPSKAMVVRAISLAAACVRFIHVGDDLRDVVRRMDNGSWFRPPTFESLDAMGGSDPFPDRSAADWIYLVYIPGTKSAESPGPYWVWLLLRTGLNGEPMVVEKISVAMGQPKSAIPLTVVDVHAMPINYLPAKYLSVK